VVVVACRATARYCPERPTTAFFATIPTVFNSCDPPRFLALQEVYSALGVFTDAGLPLYYVVWEGWKIMSKKREKFARAE
jgi:hypothetical protein